MRTVLLSDKELSVEIQMTDNPTVPDLLTDDARLNKLRGLLRSLNTVIALSSFTIQLNATTGEYDYEWTAKDSRKWKQVIDYNRDSDPKTAKATFDEVKGYWTPKESMLDKELQEYIVLLIKQLDISSLEITWQR